jgi:peptide/nickel transport system substrate-binding protein
VRGFPYLFGVDFRRVLRPLRDLGAGLIRWNFWKHVQAGTVVFALAVAAACQAPSDSEETQDLAGVFRYNEPTGIATLDPAFAREQATLWTARHLFTTLVELDDQLRPQPLLAKKWEVNGQTLRFTLRSDVFFHTGPGMPRSRRVVASDVVYSLERLRSADLASPGAWVLDRLEFLHAPNDTTVELRFAAGGPSPFGLLAMPYCSVVPRESVQALGDAFGRSPVGSGPFVFQAWREGEKLVLRRNARYFERDSLGTALPYLEAVSIRFVADRQAAFLSFLSGELDEIHGVDVAYKDQLLTRSGKLQSALAERFRLQVAPYLNTEYLAIRMEQPKPAVLSDVRVRTALSLAVDRQALVRHLKNGMGIPAHGGMIPSGMPGYRSAAEWTAPFTYRPDEAKRLLQAAGCLDARGVWQAAGGPVVLSTTESGRDVCEFVQGQWTALGVPVQVEVVPASAFRESKSQGGLAVFKASWIADYPDAENYLSLFDSRKWTPRGPNYTRTALTGFDAALDRATHAPAGPDRDAQMAQLDQRIHDAVPVIPLWYDVSVRVLPKSVDGIPQHPLFLLDLRRARKK